MSRTARKLSSTNVYHIVIRGIDRQRLFLENNDYQKYLDLLNYYKSECGFHLYAYCLMSNHVHLLICTLGMELHVIFRRLGTAYAEWFNMKYNRVGSLQQGRFYSEPVETTSYLHNVVRYIHFNPAKAGIESFPGEKYPWSSYDSYFQSPGFVDTQTILESMGGIKHFKEYHSSPCNDICLDIDTIRRRIPDDVAVKIINTTCHCPNIVAFQELPLLTQAANLLLLHKKGLSERQLNRLTGTPLGFIRKVIVKNR